MAHQVGDESVWVGDERAPDASRLVGERVGDLQLARDRLSMDGVNVRDLDRNVWMNPRLTSAPSYLVLAGVGLSSPTLPLARGVAGEGCQGRCPAEGFAPDPVP